MSFEELLHYFRLGGVTLGVILAASLLALGVAIERLVALWGFSERARELGQTIMRHLLRLDVAAARTAAERSTCQAADMFLAGFERHERQKGLLGSAVERERAQVGLKLRRNMWILGTIGAVAPFVGLFGTVAGIMGSFRDLGLDVSQGGTGGPAAVMTGISEALITTAMGILVAVEAVILYNYFQARLARISVELRLMSEEFVELLRDAPSVPSSSTSTPSSTAVPSASSLPAPEGA